MKRRKKLASLAVGLSSVMLSASAAQTQPEVSSSKPNIIVFLTDDQRWDTLTVNQPDLPIQTPAIDRLAREGVNFTNGFVTTPICAVSRASILSGRYSRNCRVHCFMIPFPEDIFPSTYPAVLKQGGYFIGQLGKYGIGATDAQRDSFNFFDADLSQGPAFREYQGGKVHDSEWLTRRTRDFLDAVPAGKPFALQVNYKAPHPSSVPAPEDKGTLAGVPFPRHPADRPEFNQSLPQHVRLGYGGNSYERHMKTDAKHQQWIRDYFEKIISVDRSVGDIVKELEARGLADNTILLFLSDHGTHFGERQLAAKWTPFDASLRIPFIIYDPRARDSAGTTRKEMVLNIDVAPTLMELAGLEIPDGIDGKSLVPLLAGRTPTDWRKHFFFEHQTSPAVAPRPIPRNMGVRTETAKYVRWTDPDPVIEEFYNLSSDPDEVHNRVEENAERTQQLRSLFEQWERENPDTYTFISYSHRPQSGNPVIDFEKLQRAFPQSFGRIKKAVEEMGVTWEQAANDPEIRWQIGLRSGYFY